MKSLPAGLIINLEEDIYFLTLGEDKVVFLCSNDSTFYEENQIYHLTPRGQNDWYLSVSKTGWYGELISRDWNGNISVNTFSLYDDEYSWDFYDEYYLNRYQDYKY